MHHHAILKHTLAHPLEGVPTIPSFGGPPARLKTWNLFGPVFCMVTNSLRGKLSVRVLEDQITVNNVSAPHVHSLKAPTSNPQRNMVHSNV